MLKRISLCLPLLLTLACDSGDESVEARSADEPDAIATEHGDHDREGHFDHGKKMVDHLCGEIECSDDQRESIAELLAANKPERGPEGEGREDFQRALADAFRAETFDLAALPKPDDQEAHEAHRTQMATTIVGLHDLLTAEQRELIAAKIEAGGPMGLLGHGPGMRGHGKRGEGERGQEGDAAKHAELEVERLCATLTCTEAQVEELGSIFTDAMAELAPPEPAKVDDALETRFAAAFRADALALADVEALLDATRPAKPPRPAMDELLVSIHAVLTPEQRGLLADEIAERGPHAIFGGKGKHGHEGEHGKRGHKGKHGKHGKREVEAGEPA